MRARGRVTRRVSSVLLGLALLLGALTHARVVAAVPAQQLVSRAREAAARGAWNESARSLEELVAAGLAGDDVLYDLGVAYARAGRFGEAIWRFEQVARRAVFAFDAEHNLRVTRLALAHRDAARTGRAVVETAPPTVVWAGEILPAHVAGALSLAAQAAALACLWALRARRRAGRLRGEAVTRGEGAEGGELSRVGFAIGAVTFGVCAVLTGAMVGARAASPAEGVVLREGVRLLQSPSPDAIAAQAVREGARVELLGQSGTFVRVRARDESGATHDGWVAIASVGAL